MSRMKNYLRNIEERELPALRRELRLCDGQGPLIERADSLKRTIRIYEGILARHRDGD